jgi:DNA-binding transcriptional MocR family regulator
VPTFSNPSGKTMALSHRESLLVLARKYDALIITDDVYDFLQWPTALSSPAGPGLSSSLTKALLPRIVDIDSTLQPVPGPEDFGNAVSNGSFSKIAGPGVRTGFAEATRKFIYGLSQCGSSRSGGAPSQMTATVMYELLKSSALQAHIEEVLKPAYQKRHLLILQAIVTHLLPLGVTTSRGDVEGRDVFGGYFVWLELPEGIDAEAVTSWSREKENLIIAPGRIFEVEGDESVRFKSGIRLCFAWEEEAELVEGVARLARAIKAVIKGENNWSADSDTEIAKQGFGEFK